MTKASHWTSFGLAATSRIEVAAGLLLAFHEHLDPDRRLAAEEAQRRGDDHDARLVVGGAAAIHAAVANLRLERLHVPTLFHRRGLDVVVGIEQDGRLAGGRGDVGVDGGIAARHVEQARAGDAVALQEIDDGLGGLQHRLGREAGEGAGRNADECGEVFGDLDHHPFGENADFIDGHGFPFCETTAEFASGCIAGCVRGSNQGNWHRAWLTNPDQSGVTTMKSIQFRGRGWSAPSSGEQ